MLGLLLALILSKPPDLLTPPAGNTRVLRQGNGKVHPTDNDIVKVSYVVWDHDGTVVDKVNDPNWLMVDVKEASPEWRAALLKMVAGEQRRTWNPSTQTVFDMELIEIFPRPEPPPDVNYAPPDAIRTPSGLAYKILREGPGKVHPKPGDKVLVGYTGWTSDGKFYDSTVLRGQPAMELPVSGGIKGWTEAIQLITSGSKMRVWIPAVLAFWGVPDKPQNMLVFDIELYTVSSEIMEKRGRGRKGPAMPAMPPLPPGVH